MNDEGRRCGLPGCEIEIEIAHGRPERRYCCAAHRAAARRERRAATTHVRRSPTSDLAETLPWLREAAAADRPDPGVRDPDGAPDGGAGPVLRPVVHRVTMAEPGVVARAAARRSRGGRTTRPRRRALAMLGVAGILAGGYAVLAQPHASVPALTTPDAGTTDAWAQRANVALAAVNRQLDTLAHAEQQWQQLPASRSGVVPAPVTALEERRSVLQQRRATLQSQLDAYHSLHETEQDLADSEQHLKVMDDALADVPPADRRSPAQEAAAAALDEQRDLRIRQRDTQRTQLQNLEDGVSAAARTPLPDDSAATAEVSNDVLEMVRNGGRAPDRPDPAPPRPDVVGGRENDDDPPSRETPSSGPPDPRGPRDDSEERRPAPERQVVPSQVGPPRPVPRPVSPPPVSPPASTPTASAPPASAPPASAPPASTQPGPAPDPAGTLAQLRARARAAVQEAQDAGPAQTTAPIGTPAPRLHPVPHPRADGAHRSVPSPTPSTATQKTSDPGAGAGQDDDAIEEQNGHRSSRSPGRDAHDRKGATGRHSSGTTASAMPPRPGAHRAAEPDKTRSEKSPSKRSGSAASDRPALSLDTQDGYIRLSRSLASTSSRDQGASDDGTHPPDTSG